jgi:DNA-binding CsgD family transcriptional regulator
MDESRRPSPDTDPLSLVGAAVLEALELIDLPAYVVDRRGTLRWANRAASRLIGDRVDEVEAHSARKPPGGDAAYALTVLDSAGRFFGPAVPQRGARGVRTERAGEARLTRRQAEVLRLLGEGLSTEAIASRLGIAVETARNHIRAVLRGLDVHSRLEAVVAGRERGLLDE